MFQRYLYILEYQMLICNIVGNVKSQCQINVMDFSGHWTLFCEKRFIQFSSSKEIILLYYFNFL